MDIIYDPGLPEDPYTVRQVTVSLVSKDGKVVSKDSFILDRVVHDFEGRKFESDYGASLSLTKEGKLTLLAHSGEEISSVQFVESISSVTLEENENQFALKFVRCP